MTGQARFPVGPLVPDPDDLRDAADRHVAAWNAVAAAAIAYREERHRLAYMLALARTHGLNVADLCQASGMDEPTITQLLEEAP